MKTDTRCLDLGAWIGRSQAFGLVSDHCLAARAQCLEAVRDSAAYRTLNLTWEQFCERHAGISRATADRLIQNRKQFGDAYFHLSEIMRISPAGYRKIEGHVTEDGIEFEGETIPITPENAAKIRRAVNALRAELRESEAARFPLSGVITRLQSQLDVSFSEISTLVARPLDPACRAALQGLLHYAASKLRRLTRDFQAAQTR